MSKIRDYLLMKATRDRSRLVQVQRTVSRGGKTFIQNYWISPSAVKPTDRVVANQQLLQQVAAAAPQPTQGTGTAFDKAHFDSLAKTDRTQAMAYLNQCGITWKTNAHAGINWMRAMQAAKKAGNTAQTTTAQVSTHPANGATQAVQTVQSNANVQVDAKLQAELDACVTSKDKVILLKKKLGPAGCMNFAKQMGVTWTENAHAGINQMRMSMALQKWFDANPSLAGKVGAPIGNQNAKKGTTSAKPAPAPKTNNKPKVDPDLVPVPKNATPRQKNLIDLVNKITDVDELKKFETVGMLPEDKLSKSYILDKLVPKYTVWKESTDSGNEYYNDRYDFSSMLLDLTNPVGCAKKKVLDMGPKVWYDYLSPRHISEPRNCLTIVKGTNSYNKVSVKFTGFMRALYQDFSTFSSDDHEGYLTNCGYTGWDTDKLTKQYDPDKDGFLKVINKIKDSEKSVDLTAEEMSEDYKEMMKRVGYNPKLLKMILDMPTWKDASSTTGTSSNFPSLDVRGNIDAYNAGQILKEFEEKADILQEIFKQNNVSPDEAMLAIRDFSEHWIAPVSLGIGPNKDFRLDRYVDVNGNKVFNIRDIDILFSNSEAYLSYFHDTLGWNIPPNTDPKIINRGREDYLRVKAIASVTKKDHDEILALALKMTGTKLKYNDGKGTLVDVKPEDLGKYTDMDNMRLMPSGPDKNKDFILSNLMIVGHSCASNRAVVKEITSNKASSLNKNGTDFSNNFSYYTPNRLPDGQMAYRTKYSGDTTNGFSSADELNKVVAHQLDVAPILSMDYVEGFKNTNGAYSVNMATALDGLKITQATLVQSPLKDVIFSLMKNLYQNVPKMDTDKLDKTLARRLNYRPYDFNSSVQLGFNEKPKNTNESLKQVREKTLKAVHCSIMAEDEKTSEAMRKDFLDRWDYDNSGTQKCPDGITRRTTYTKGNGFKNAERRALFNSRFFKVKNSNMEENYDNYRAELTKNSQGETKEMDLFSAMSYSACAGILGATGGWEMKGKLTKVGTAMGNGAYFGYRGGKSVPYCGEKSGGYAGTNSSGSQGDNANGCYILANVIRGDAKDSTSDHGRFHDFELCAHTNKIIKPHHFVDISVRTMGVNATRDKDGNYMASEDSSKITHDKNGVSLDKKYF